MREVSDPEVAFSEELPVRVRYPDREAYVAQLTCRVAIEAGTSPVLAVLLTDEQDPFFLYSLRVLDADFHTLKTEQSLLVDFQTFPGMLASLLGDCRPGGKFSAQLTVGSEGTLAVVEANGFRELTHVSLKFRKGNDEAVKGYLAGRLSSLKGDLGTAQERLRAQDEDLRRNRVDREQLTTGLRTATEEKQQVERAAKLRADTAIAELREQHGRELSEKGLTSQRERAEAEGRLQEALRAAEARALRAEAARDELTLVKDQLTSSLAGTQRQLDAAQASLQDTEASLAERREKGQANERDRFELEKKVAGLTVQCASYAEQLSGKEKLLASAAEMKQAGDSQKVTVEDSLHVVKATLTACEEKYSQAVKEIDRGNHIINTLQTQVKSLKGKLRVKATALVAQEKGVVELERGLETEKRLAMEQRRELEAATMREGEARTQSDEGSHRLREAQELLASNKQVIDFLNKQLTDRELAFGLGATPGAGFGASGGFTSSGLGGFGGLGDLGSTAPAAPGTSPYSGAGSRRLLSEGYLAALHGDRARSAGLDATYAGAPATPQAGRTIPASPGLVSNMGPRSLGAVPSPGFKGSAWMAGESSSIGIADTTGGRSLDAFLPTSLAPPLLTGATPPRGPIHYVRPDTAKA